MTGSFAGGGMGQDDVAPARDTAFTQFVLGREQALQRTAWLLTGDWALAEDLVQTALARSWPRWAAVRPPARQRRARRPVGRNVRPARGPRRARRTDRPPARGASAARIR